jgi:hypothetical protein
MSCRAIAPDSSNRNELLFLNLYRLSESVNTKNRRSDIIGSPGARLRSSPQISWVSFLVSGMLSTNMSKAVENTSGLRSSTKLFLLLGSHPINQYPLIFCIIAPITGRSDLANSYLGFVHLRNLPLFGSNSCVCEGIGK